LKNHITVIDSPVGMGKTKWAISHINNLPDEQKFIFITPLLSEIERIQKECPNKDIYAPEPEKWPNNTKSKSFKQALLENRNIASTHSLFLKIDEEVIELLRKRQYTLILDEVFNVVTRFNFFEKFELAPDEEDQEEHIIAQDIKILQDAGLIKVRESDYKIIWIKDTSVPVQRFWTFRNGDFRHPN